MLGQTEVGINYKLSERAGMVGGLVVREETGLFIVTTVGVV